MKYDYIQQEAFEANMLLPQLDLVIFTFGNVSAADHHAGVFAIKPSGVPYAELQPENMVIVDFEGKTVDGTLKPSSDTLTHALLYQNWPEINGIAHTHSTYATAWCQAQRDVPIMGTTHADHLTVDIPCAPPISNEMIKGNYELQTGNQILDELKNRGLSYQEVEMILLANHAPFCWGNSARKAVYNSAVLEACAKMALLSLQINPDAPRLKDSLINKHYQRKHGPDSYYGQS